MAFFVVVYNSNQDPNGTVADQIDAALHAHTQYNRLNHGTWLVDVNIDMGQLFQNLMGMIASSDGLLVAPTQQPWATNSTPFPTPISQTNWLSA